MDHILPLISKLEDSGVGFAIGDGGENASIDVLAKDRELFHVDIKTLPYPGFPTDMQSLLTAYLATCAGESEIIETVFENRFMHIGELKKLGARIEISGQTARVLGDDKLRGANVRATDLRSGAALIVAALAADGETVITDVHHIDRGYENYVEKLKALGAEVSEE
jgi:UDP-N-acetylglucosamine 1-carboxyvinyltransferase